jgi:hypothetical protein
MSTTFIVFGWILSQTASGSGGNRLAEFFMGEENPEKLPHRVTLPAKVKKARNLSLRNKTVEQFSRLSQPALVF